MKVRDALSLALALVAAPVLLLAARTSPEARAQDTPTVAIQSAGALGAILVDTRGFTLYVFDRDTPGTSACVDACVQIWPPLLIGSGDPVAPPDLPGALFVVERPDGARQVAYNDRPLYTYSRDAQSGDTGGDGVGGTWHVVRIEGVTPLSTPPAAEPSPAPSPSAAPQPTTTPAPTTTIRTVPADTPAGTVLLSDDFSDPTRPTLPASSSFGYVDGEYFARPFLSTAGGVLIRVPLRARNTTMTVDARLLDDSRGREIELDCRIQPGQPLNGYAALVEPSQRTVTIIRIDGGVSRVLDPARTIAAVNSGGAINRIALSCIGDTITVEINGVPASSARDNKWAEGQLGLGVGARLGNSAAEARFDNLVIVQR